MQILRDSIANELKLQRLVQPVTIKCIQQANDQYGNCHAKPPRHVPGRENDQLNGLSLCIPYSIAVAAQNRKGVGAGIEIGVCCRMYIACLNPVTVETAQLIAI